MGNDKKFVRDSFAAIAPRYDLLNSLLSLGIEASWRRRVVRCLAPASGQQILDLCAGTLTLSRDIARDTRNQARIVSADFCFEMLEEGAGRLAPHQKEMILPLCADAETLPLADASFDSALVTYGIRNLAHADHALAELFRVLKPGGRLVILDFTRPRNALFASVYGFYLKRCLPLIGGMISGSPSAYRHLSDSIEAFMERETLLDLMRKTGFLHVEIKVLTFGIAGIFSAKKP